MSRWGKKVASLFFGIVLLVGMAGTSRAEDSVLDLILDMLGPASYIEKTETATLDNFYAVFALDGHSFSTRKGGIFYSVTDTDHATIALVRPDYLYAWRAENTKVSSNYFLVFLYVGRTWGETISRDQLDFIIILGEDLAETFYSPEQFLELLRDFANSLDE